MAETETLAEQLKGCVEKRDFEGALGLVRGNLEELKKSPQSGAVKDALKKATDDRLLQSYVDGAGFGELPLDAALVRLEKLISFQVGSLVLNRTWGVGKVKKVDYFYRRVTVDFPSRRGHQFTYAAAADMLESAPDGHILVLREVDPAAFESLLKEKPGEFVKRVIESNGSSMTLVRLEDYCVANGFVKGVNWKKFWDTARAELRRDKCVVIPARKSDPIQVTGAAEDYGDVWLEAFSHETDPKAILAAVREYVAQGKLKAADDAVRAKIEDRLVFAVTAARKVDDALYARLACTVAELGFARPTAKEMRDYLWERRRYIKAAAALPSREVGAMISFLACDDAAKAKIYAAIPEFCFAAVDEIVKRFRDDKSREGEAEVWPCRKAVGDFMKETQAPATLTTLIAGRIEQFGEFEYADVEVDGKKIRTLKGYKLWPELPPISAILAHAIALGEGRRSGETLRMQNLVRRLFGDKAWLEKMFRLLGMNSTADQVLFFERFQASIAWDPSTHHTTVVRMAKLVPELEKHIVKVEKKREYARLTSYRSFGLRKQEYLKLINEDMPENVRKIEFAKGFGDLSENAEYQYAKDEQRQLMQKQTLMQADLEAVKPSDFADATTDEVMPGVTVVADTKDGEKVWHILGEWDNDPELGILSSKTRVAQGLLGKKPGDGFELPDADGGVAFATIREIRPLPDSVREWMKLPAGVQI